MREDLIFDCVNFLTLCWEDLIFDERVFDIWLCKNFIFYEKIWYLMREDLIFDERGFNIWWEKI